jgi:hypothetical protein
MANEEDPKSAENPLAEVAKSIGSTLGTAANRASEMLRDVMPAALSEKLGVGGPQAKSAAGSERQSKPKKAAGAKKAQSGAKKKSASGKFTARKKSKSARPTAKKKVTRSAKKKSVRKSR